MKLSPAIAKEVRRLALDVVLLDGEQDEAPSLMDMARRAKRLLDGPLKERRVAKVVALPGLSRDERRELQLYDYDQAKAEALVRSAGRCEWHTDGRRCTETGCDPHHVLGGAYRKECERLGVEGLEVLCRQHHDQATLNLPTRAAVLAQAKEFAIRIGGRRLLAMVERAMARDQAKHGGKANGR